MVEMPQEQSVYPSLADRPQTLPGLLRWRSGTDGARVALSAADGTLTFAEWATRAARAASRLTRAGVRPGTPVAIWLENRDGCAFAVALLGVQWAGAIAVPMSHRLPVAGLEEALARLELPYVIAAGTRASLSAKLIPIDELLRPGEEVSQQPQCVPSALAAILQTSGTTGLPKAATFTHEAFAFLGAATEDHILGSAAAGAQLTSDDVIQTAVPLHTTSGLMHVLTVCLYTGVRCVCEASFDTASTIETMRAEGTTIWLCVPAMMNLLADERDEPVEGVSARLIWHMGSIITAHTLARVRRILPNVSFVNLYGLTETGAGLCSSNACDAIELPGSIGRPIPTTEVRLLDDAGDPVGSRVDGRLFIRSPHMLSGYWAHGRLVPANLEDGWIETGDGAYADDRGRLMINGRLGDVIVRGGFNIHPSGIEAALLSHPVVQDVAVVPLPHRILGHDIVALITADQPIDVDVLKAHCAALLPDNEVPRRLIEVDELPRNEFGKLDKKATRSLAEARVATHPTATSRAGIRSR
jgi:long-chain acyl-CoA synthetase